MDEIEIPDIPDSRSADLAVPVAGNSMIPTYYDSDVLLIHAQDAVNVGDIVLFAINGDGFVKKWATANRHHITVIMIIYQSTRALGVSAR